MKELDEIDRLFQSEFNGFEPVPDPVVKENIDRAIASKKKRRKFLFLLFPVLFITAATAAVLYSHSFSGDDQSKALISQSTKPHADSGRNSAFLRHEKKQVLENKSDGSIKKSIESPDNQTVKEISIDGHNNVLLRQGKSNLSRNKSRLTTNIHTANSNIGSEKQPAANGRNNILLYPAHPGSNPETITGRISPATPLISDSVSTRPNPTSEIAEVSKPDSTSLPASDSAQNTISQSTETSPQSLPEPPKMASKWSWAILGGWEAEKKRSFESFDTTTMNGKRKEFAAIHSTSFYGKLEVNRKLNPQMDLILGIGFRSTKTTQYTSLYTRDSVIIIDGVSSAPPTDSVHYFIRNQTGTQVYRIHSIIVPLGLSWQKPISSKLHLRFSGGVELAYGWISKQQVQADFSAPKFQSFGCNLWLRPELHYDFGKVRVFGFGTLNQGLSQQLKWDFNVRRNPMFGAGIGLFLEL